jgi:glycosyltransferase involved in cell wall biosynthesis
MACGCAVIADSVQPRPEFLGNGVAEFNVEAGNREQLVDALVLMVSMDDDSLQSMMVAARDRFIRYYSREVVASQYCSLFEKCLEDRSEQRS